MQHIYRGFASRCIVFDSFAFLTKLEGFAINSSEYDGCLFSLGATFLGFQGFLKKGDALMTICYCISHFLCFFNSFTTKAVEINRFGLWTLYDVHLIVISYQQCCSLKPSKCLVISKFDFFSACPSIKSKNNEKTLSFIKCPFFPRNFKTNLIV